MHRASMTSLSGANSANISLEPFPNADVVTLHGVSRFPHCGSDNVTGQVLNIDSAADATACQTAVRRISPSNLALRPAKLA